MKRLLVLVLMVVAQTGVGQTTFRRPVYINYSEFGGLFGRVVYGNTASQTVESRTTFTAQTFNGVQINSWLAMGSLVGVDWYTGALLTPVGAGLRLHLTDSPEQRMRLLAIADAGYGFTWFNKNSTGYETKGGWMINPGLALCMGKPSLAGFLMSISYKRQTVDVQKPLSGVDIERNEHRIYNRICFRVGVTF